MKIEAHLSAIIERRPSEEELAIASALWNEELMHTALLQHLNPLPFSETVKFPVSSTFVSEIENNSHLFGTITNFSSSQLSNNIHAAKGSLANLVINISDFSCAISKPLIDEREFIYKAGQTIYQLIPAQDDGWREGLLALKSSINNISIIYSAEHGALLESMLIAYISDLGIEWNDGFRCIPYVNKYEFLVIASEDIKPELADISNNFDFKLNVVGVFNNEGVLSANSVNLQIDKIFENAPVATINFIPPERPKKLSSPQVSYKASDLLNSLKILLSDREIKMQTRLDDFIKFSRNDDVEKDIILATSACPWLIRTDPFECGRSSVINAYNLLSSKGGTPLSIIIASKYDLDFKDAGLAYLSPAIRGIAEACIELSIKVDGFNAIYSTDRVLSSPFIFMLGYRNSNFANIPSYFSESGQTIIRIGNMSENLGQSIFAKRIWDQNSGDVTSSNIKSEIGASEIIKTGIMMGWIRSCRPVSRGGQLTTIAIEAALAGIGCKLNISIDPARAFNEDTGRYIVTTSAKDAELLLRRAPEAGIDATAIGETGGDTLILDDERVSIYDLREYLGMK